MCHPAFIMRHMQPVERQISTRVSTEVTFTSGLVGAQIAGAAARVLQSVGFVTSSQHVGCGGPGPQLSEPPLQTVRFTRQEEAGRWCR